jgi:hypothetical protein
MVLEHIRKYGEITQGEALQKYSVARLASRINDLRKEGNHIETYMMKGYNRFGKTTQYACYRMGIMFQ